MKKIFLHVLLSFSLSFSLVSCTSWPSLFILMLGGGGGSGGLLIIPPGGGGGGTTDDGTTDDGTTDDGTTDDGTTDDGTTDDGTTDDGTTDGGDPTTPTVNSVTTDKPAGTYPLGEEILVTIAFDQAVVVSGTPELLLNNGATATYVSGSGTSNLVFKFTVESEVDNIIGLDQKNSTALDLNGGSIKGSNGSLTADVTLANPGATGSLSASSAVNIDATAPIITSVNSSNDNGSYSHLPIPNTIEINITYSEAVNVSGTPRLKLNTAPTQYAEYSGGSGTDTISFTYTISDGDSSAKLDYTGVDDLDLNGGAITDLPGNTAVNTLPAIGSGNSLSDNKSLEINTNIPAVENVSSTTSAGLYDGAGTEVGSATNPIKIQVKFSEAVTVSGTPQINLETGSNDGIASYIGGSGTNTLTFDYAIGSGQYSDDLDVTSAAVIDLNGGTIEKAVDTNVSASLVLPTSGSTDSLSDNEAIRIDSVAPTVQSVTSDKANDSYGVGEEIPIKVIFSEVVNVTNTPTFVLSTGTIDYTGGTGSDTLTFLYTVQSGDTTSGADLNYTITSALIGTIADLAGNAANLTLPAVAGSGSLAGTKDIKINAIVPDVQFTTISSSADEIAETVNIAISLSAATSSEVKVNYALKTADVGSAVNGADYSFTAGTLTFAKNETSKNITFTVSHDTVTELDETIKFQLSGQVNANLGTNSVYTYTIEDNDNPTVAFDAASSNGGESTTTVTIPVSLSDRYAKEVKVDYAIKSGDTGTATGSGTDYTLASGTLTFAAGTATTSQDISFTVNDDSATELNETIKIELTANTNSNIGTNSVHTYTINDNDDPSVAFDSTSSNGDESATTVTIPVSLSAQYAKEVKVDYVVKSGDTGTATGSGTDYTLTSGTLTFAAGTATTSQEISFTVNDDSITELDETVKIELTANTNGSIGTNSVHTYTIQDNDNPTVAFGTASSNGDESTTAIDIPVSLSAQSAKEVKVDYAIKSGGTATGGGDDYAFSSGTLTFAAGTTTTTQNISFSVVDDGTTELNETVLIELTVNSNAAIGTNSVHTYTIQDNDDPTIAFNAASSNGDESVTTVNIPVSLSAQYAKEVKVNYAVKSGDTGTATGSGTDYTLTSGTLTFAAGTATTSQDISFTVNDDSITELDETVKIELTTNTNGSIGTNSVHTYTIQDNDNPTVAFGTASSSGDESTTAIDIPVSLSAQSAKEVKVDYAIKTGGTATGGGSDYAFSTGTLTFAAGTAATTQNISFSVVDDSDTELNETILIELTVNANANIGTNSVHTYTINDNDDPSLAFDSTSSNGDESATTVTIPVSLSAQYAKEVKVDYAVKSGDTGTATGSGTDYTLASGTLTFTAGTATTSQNISFTVNDDSDTELNETVKIELIANTNVCIGTNSVHTYTIEDNDNPTVAFDAASSNGDESVTTVNIPVSLSAQYAKEVKVDYAVKSGDTGTATGSGTDYTLTSGTLTFAAGTATTSQDISFSVLNDTIDELDETIKIELTANTNGSIGANSVHTYTITDNDTAGITLSQSTATVNETGTTTVDYTVSLSSQPTDTVTIGFATSPQLVNIPEINFSTSNWNTPQTITIQAFDDDIDEGSHTHTLTHTSSSSGDSNYSGKTANIAVTINDNDTAGVTLSSNTSTATEGGSNGSYTVRLNSEPTQNVTIAFTTGTQVDNITSLVFTLADWDIAQTVNVIANDDTSFEGSHTQDITHAATSSDGKYDGISITDNTVTITDNDTASIVITETTDTNVTEGGTTDTYSVKLSSKPTDTVTVEITTDGQTTAKDGSNSTTLTFTTSNWNTAQTVTVTADDDASVESSHNSTITHTASSTGDSNYDGKTAALTAHIIDNDSAGVSITLTDSSTDVTEGGTTDTYTVVLTSLPSDTVTINLTHGSDVSLSDTSLEFTTDIWDTPQTITVTAVDDDLYEGTQTDTISHSATSTDTNYTIASDSIGSVAVTISDNETVPTITINDASQSEGDSSTATVQFTVGISPQAENAVTVTYSTADGPGEPGANTADSDYVAATGATVTIPGSTSSANLDVTINGDTKNENDEIFYVNLTNTDIGNLDTDTQGQGTITNDDNLPTVEFNLASSSSGDESATDGTINVKLSEASGKTVTVVVTDTGSGNATPGTDYTAIGSPVTLTFNPGDISEDVIIPVLQDLLFEGDETISLSLGSTTNATTSGGQQSHIFTITDDEVNISSASTLDCDNDGKIDHYKLEFLVAVEDSTFPGYTENALGSITTDWVVSGRSSQALRHGTAVNTACPYETDSPNDDTLYLSFTEIATGYDTGAKPDLVTSDNPGLTATALNDNKKVGRIGLISGDPTPGGADLVEADTAKPVIVGTSGNTNSNVLTVTYSEPVYGATGVPACGSGGNLGTATISYLDDVSSDGASSVSGMGTDTCATDNTAQYTMDTNFTSSDNNTDKVAASVSVYDASDNTGNINPYTLSITVGPAITEIAQYDTDSDGKIDQLKVTLSTNLQDSSVTDSDASQFTLGGTALTKIDSSAGGSGIITTPNNDSGTSDDTVITVFSDDFTVLGTDKKAMAFTTSSSKWVGSGLDLQSVADLSSVVVDKAPPVILTAVAAENATAGAGIDSDDTLVLTFSEATNKPTINNGNIASIFSLSSSHTWNDITSATWNGTGDELTVTFAGTGSPTISVGDYVTILGTITDTATTPNTSVNIQSLNPISGLFEVEVPVLTTASSMDPTTVRITYSKPVNNTEATTVGYYKIADSASVSGTCSDNSNFTGSTSSLSISSITKVDDYTYDLTTATQVNGNSYSLIADKSNVNHKDYATYNISCPNNANFIGQEKLKISNVVCGSLQTIVATFSKPIKTGVNGANSAECDTTTECAKRYVIKGTVSGTEVGDITSVKVLDGTVCGGLAANTNKVCITHTLNQNGSIYALVAANNTDGDGFDDTSFGALQDTSGTENLLNSPKDRGSFTGCGITPHNFIDGPVISDPFADGTAFGYLEKYNNKIYIGPNKNGNGATRFNADGSSPENLTFEIQKDTTGSRKSDSAGSAPFESIGATGCIREDSSSSGCGPNNENGRGNFSVGTFGGVEYLFISGTKVNDAADSESNKNNDYLYYTADTDAVLNFNYIDASWGFDNRDTCNGSWSSSVIWNAVSESIHVFNEVIYWSVPGTGTNRPFLTRIHSIPSDGEVVCGNHGVAGKHGRYMNMRYMPGVGRIAVGSKDATPDNLGGHFNSFNDRVYFMNSGSITFDSSNCKEGDTYSAGVCEQDGGVVRSTNNKPTDCTSAGCTEWADITPSSTDYKKYFTIGLPADDTEMANLIPAQKPTPGSTEFQGKYYFIRNACTQVMWDDGCGFGSNCSDDMKCPAGSEIPQLWKCDPSLNGNATECDSGDWSLVAQNGATGKTNFGDGNNTHITMVADNGDYLYVGFDNPTSGIEVWRTNVSDPSGEGDFSQIGGDGFGSGTDITEIYDHVSLNSGSIHYLYLSIGKGGVPVKVHRQQNTGPVTFNHLKHKEEDSFLMTYLGKKQFGKFSFMLLLMSILLSVYLYQKVKKGQKE